MRPLRIAMIGQRGVPATFGGIERHVEEVGSGLAARGHDVTVYCRSNYVEGAATRYRGLALRHLPTVGTKHLDAIAHSALSTLAALWGGFDIIHYHALGPGLLAPVARAAGRAKVVLTVHGMDNQRGKWGPVGRSVLGMAAWMASRIPDTTIVVSRALAAHYAERYRSHVDYVPNGVNAMPPRPAQEIVTRFGLEPRGYVLFVGRFVPEKAPDLLLRAFQSLPGDLRLVIAGGSCYTDRYVESIHELAAGDPRILLPGYVYGSTLHELYSNAAAFVLPSRVEGLPLTLLEASACGVPIIASDIQPHVEVIGQDGPGHHLFPAGDEKALREALRATLAEPAAAWRGAAALRQDVLRRYRWEDAVLATERIYARLLGTSARMEGRPGLPASCLARPHGDLPLADGRLDHAPDEPTTSPLALLGTTSQGPEGELNVKGGELSGG